MKKVLVVDDDISIRKLVAATLRKQKVTVFQAITAAEGLHLAQVELPDLIVMDVILPGQNQDGIITSHLIKRNPITAMCKILLISGVVSLDEEELARSGADGFLSKPFNPIELRNKITRMLGRNPQALGA